MFPIAPHFYPICFTQSCPLFTYISGPKGRHSIFKYKFRFPRASKNFNFFGAMGQSKWLIVKKKKVELGKNIICLEHFGIYIVG